MGMGDPEKLAAKCDALFTCALKEKEEKGKLPFCTGKTRTYYRLGALEFLEQKRSEALFGVAQKIQALVRGHLGRRSVRKLFFAKEEAARLAKEEAERAEREKLEAAERAEREKREAAERAEREKREAAERKEREKREAAERKEREKREKKEKLLALKRAKEEEAKRKKEEEEEKKR